MKCRLGDLNPKRVSGFEGWRGMKHLLLWAGVGLLCAFSGALSAEAQIVPPAGSDFEVRFLQGGTLVQVQVGSLSGGSSASIRSFTGAVVRDGVRELFPSNAVLTRPAGQSQIWEYETANLNAVPVLRIQYDASGSGSLKASLGSSGDWVAGLKAYELPPGVPVPGSSHVFAYRLNDVDPAVSTGNLNALISRLEAGSGSLVASSTSAVQALKIHSDFESEIKKLKDARLAAARNLVSRFATANVTASSVSAGTSAALELADRFVEGIEDNFRNPWSGDGNTWVSSLLSALRASKTAEDLLAAYDSAWSVEFYYPANYSLASKLGLGKQVADVLDVLRAALFNYRSKARAYRDALKGIASARETLRGIQVDPTRGDSLASALKAPPLAYSSVDSKSFAEDLLTSVEDYLNAAAAAQADQSSGVLWVGTFESAIDGRANELRTVLSALAAPESESMLDPSWQEQIQPQLEGMPSSIWLNISDRLPESNSTPKLRAILKVIIPKLLEYLNTYKRAVVADLGVPKSSADISDLDEFSWATVGTDAVEAVAKFKGLADIRLAEKTNGDRALAHARFNRDTLRFFQGYGWGVIRFGTLSGGDRRLVARYSGVSPAGTPWQGTSKVRVDDTGQSGFVALHLVSGTSAGVGTGAAIASSGSVNLSGLFPVSIQTETISGGSVVSVALPSSGAAVTWNRLPCVVEGPAVTLPSSGTHNILGQSSISVARLLVEFENPEQRSSRKAFGAIVESGRLGGGALNAGTIRVTLKIEPAGAKFQVLAGSLLSSGTDGIAARFSGEAPSGLGGTDNSGTFSGVLMPVAGSKTVGFGRWQSMMPSGSLGSMVVKITEGSAGTTEEESAPVSPVISGTVIAWKGVSASVLKLNVGAATAPNRTTVQLLRGGTIVNGGTVLADAQGNVSIPLAAVVGAGDYRVRIKREFLTTDSPVVESGSFSIQQRSAAGTFQALLGYETLTGANGSPNGNPYRARLRITPTDTGSLTGSLELMDLRPVRDEFQNPAPNWETDPALYPITDPFIGRGEGLEGGSAQISGGSAMFQTRQPAVLKYSLTSPPSAPLWTARGDSPITGIVYSDPGLSASLAVLDSKQQDTGHRLQLYLRGDVLQTPVELNRVPGGTIPRMEMQLILSGSAIAGGGSLVSGSSVPAALSLTPAKGAYPTAGYGWARSRLRDTYTWTVSGNTAICEWKRGTISKKSSTVGATTIAADGSIPCMLLMDSIETPILRTGTGAGTVSTTLNTTAVGMLEARLALRAPVNTAAPVYEMGADSLTYVTGATVQVVQSEARFKSSWFPLPAGYSGLAPGGFGWAERMLTRTLSKVLSANERVVLDQEYELKIENTRTGAFERVNVKAGGTASSPSLSQFPQVTPSIVMRLSVPVSTGLFSGSFKPAWTSAAVTVSGSYVRDDWGLDSKLLARGITSDVSVVWSLYRK